MIDCLLHFVSFFFLRPVRITFAFSEHLEEDLSYEVFEAEGLGGYSTSEIFLGELEFIEYSAKN